MIKKPEEVFEEENNEKDEDYPITDYELSSNPNDFNVLTLTNFIDRGVVKIPNFQRNYVWDQSRASKLIESLLIGLPVPQIFFYEEDKNSYLVIDGQQRLMSIYYYIKGRFPRDDKRVELREIINNEKTIPSNIMFDEKYFKNFNLKLPSLIENQKNRFNNENYETLIEHKLSFDLATIRCIIVKPIKKDDESDSAIFELFNRLNTGGVNLRSQEIRSSLYHSEFLSMVSRMNLLSEWRNIIGIELDLHMRDMEIILRAFSFLIDLDHYSKSVKRFLNNFSKKSKSMKSEKVKYLESLFIEFNKYLGELEPQIFRMKNGKFGTLLFENVFYVSVKNAYKEKTLNIQKLSSESILRLKNDKAYSKLISGPTSNTETTKDRFSLAERILEE